MLSTSALEAWRCHSCHNILAKVHLQPDSFIEVKCKCNAWNRLYIVERVSGVTTHGAALQVQVLALSA